MAWIRKTKLNQTKKGEGRRTGLTFTTDELSTLARLVAAGQVLTQTTSPVVARLKGALTRMGVPIPQGL